VLQDSQCCLVEIGDQGDSGINIEKIVIRDLLAVQLFEDLIEIAVEDTLLMRVLTVTELFSVVQRHT